MHRSLSLRAVLLVLALLPCAARAQDSAEVAVGARLRVRPAAEPRWQYGRYRGVERDSLVLGGIRDTTTRRYAMNSLRTIEVFRPDEGRRSVHAFNGALIGAAGSVVVLYLGVKHCDAKNRHSDGPGCGIAFAGLPIFMIEGAGIGGILGAAWPVRHWRPVAIIGAPPASGSK